MTNTKLRAAPGGSCHAMGGEIFLPPQLCTAGIVSALAKAGLVIVKCCATINSPSLASTRRGQRGRLGRHSNSLGEKQAYGGSECGEQRGLRRPPGPREFESRHTKTSWQMTFRVLDSSDRRRHRNCESWSRPFQPTGLNCKGAYHVADASNGGSAFRARLWLGSSPGDECWWKRHVPGGVAHCRNAPGRILGCRPTRRIVMECIARCQRRLLT